MNDMSDVEVSKIKDKADKLGVVIKTNVEDATMIQLNKEYDVIIATFMLHHIAIKDGLGFLSKIQKYTKSGGFNIIATFTTEGDFYKLPNSKTKCYLNPGELKEFYKSWKLIKYAEEIGSAHQKHADGTPMQNLTSYLLAQKQ
jgi:tellurite methyltransferase